MTGPGVVGLEAGADAFAASRPFPLSLHAANAISPTAIISVDTRRAGIRATVPAIVSQRSAIVHAGANAWPTSGNLDPAGLIRWRLRRFPDICSARHSRSWASAAATIARSRTPRES